MKSGFDSNLLLLRTALWSCDFDTSMSPAEVHVRHSAAEVSSAAHVTWSDHLMSLLSLLPTYDQFLQ
jgi:hypothetical protein